MKKHLFNGLYQFLNLSENVASNSKAVFKDSAMNFSVISKPELNNENKEDNLNLKFSRTLCEGNQEASLSNVSSNSSIQLKAQTTKITKTSSDDLGLGITKTDSKNNLNLSTHHLETHPHEVYELYENYEHDNFTTFGNFYETFSEGFDHCEDYSVSGGHQGHSGNSVNNFQNYQISQNYEAIKNFVTLPGQSTLELSVDKDFMETDKMFYELFKITNNYIN
jgi:hypothetical protein